MPVDTVAHRLLRRAAQSPQAIAFRCEGAGGTWAPTTWQTFATRVTTLRRGLHAVGLRRGDCIALVAPVSLGWELLHHAALSLGVVVVGLDSHDLPERIADMVEVADVSAFVTGDVRTLSGVDEQRLRKAHVVLTLGAEPGQTFSASATSQQLSLAELEALGQGSVDEPGLPDPMDAATIIFTSGTTGAPKGIVYRHSQLCLAIDAICDAFDFVDTDGRLLCWLPLSNLFQRMVNLAAVHKGVGTHLLGDPRRVMDVVGTVSPDIFVSVPRFYEKLHEGICKNIAAQPAMQRQLANWAWNLGRRASPYRLAQRPLPAWLSLAHAMADRLVLGRIRQVMGDRLRCLVSGSAPMPKHLLAELHALGWVVLEAYGLSENVLPMAMNRLDAFRFGTVGRPVVPNEVALDAAGNIRVRGPGVFSGYLGSADPPPFDTDGFYATGDLGQIDADGFLTLTGRTSELIKTSTGRRVAPVTIEAALRGVLGIDQAVLIGNGRKGLIALCTCTEGALDAAGRAALESELRRCVDAMGEHDRPLAIRFLPKPFGVDTGELTPNLKLRRSAIEQLHATAIEQTYEAVDRPVGPRSGELLMLW